MASNTATLFEKATIISYDEASDTLKTLRNASLLVEHGRIAQLVEGIIPDVPAGTEIIDASGKIISPGFVNTHHHMWQSAFRSTAANTTLAEYFTGRYSQNGPAGTHFTPKDMWLGQIACALEMIDGGTTTVLDHAHGVFTNDHIDATVNASFQSGLRIFYAHALQSIETTGYTIETGIEKLFSLSKDQRFIDNTNPVSLAVAYDGWAFTPPAANEKIMNSFINHNNTVSSSSSTAPISLLTTHFVAGPFPASNTPTLLDSLPSTSALSQSTLTTPHKLPIIFSHATFLTPHDATLLRTHPHLSISTTPESEYHYGHTNLGAELCQDCASLGVDTHFTFSSYMPFQARLWLQSLRDRRYRHTLGEKWEVPVNNPMDVQDVFLLMTKKGGDAVMGRQGDLGVIKMGARADLVVFDTTKSASLWGVRDPVAAVVLHSGGAGDVEAVMVEGRWLKRDHKLVSPLVGVGEERVEVETIRQMFEESAKRIQDFWEKEVGPPVLEVGKETVSGAKYGRTERVSVKREMKGAE